MDDERIEPPPLEVTHRYELCPIGTMAKLSALTGGVMWQPIETAPRDGTYVLLFESSDGGIITVGWWSTMVWVSPGAWITEEHRSDTVTYSPTHWAPLPQPPILDAGRNIGGAGKVAENEGENG